MLTIKEKASNLYGFVTERMSERFHRIACTVYLQAAERTTSLPVLSKYHLFENDTYGISQALYDLADELFCDSLEEHQYYPGKQSEWNEDIWSAIDLDFSESMPMLEAYLLDDLYLHWKQHYFVFIDEHRMMLETIHVEHSNLQEVW